MYNILQTGSKGNSIIYNNNIVVDVGVPFLKIKPFLKDLQIVLLTHVHSDHFNLKTIKKVAFERPTLRFAIGEHLLKYMNNLKNVDICTINKWYDYGSFKISPCQLHHDVPNFGWRIFIKQKNGDYYKIFHATDTAHLEKIEAKHYDLYAIESNYNEDEVFEQIEIAKLKGEYCYREGAINSHLSEQYVRDFIFKNMKTDSKVLRLHESTKL